jgi:hypothetical protein
VFRKLVFAAVAAALAAVSPPAIAANVAVTVDPYGSRHAISPLVYGVSFADTARLAVVPYTVNRWGGNSMTRYNWRVDVHNTASDWFFMNVPDTPLNVNDLPDGSSADRFVGGSLAGGAQPVMTMPTIGWTPKWSSLTVSQARQKRWGASIGLYGGQETDECTEACRWDDDPTGPGHCLSWCVSDAGNGCKPDGDGWPDCANGFDADIGSHPGDTSEAIFPSFVGDWSTHLTKTGGSWHTPLNGVRLYALDNEPDLWWYTHHDVHPARQTYDELWDTDTVPYATAIKAVDPAAKVLGPDVSGWCGYFTSSADDCHYFDGADRAAHGEVDLLAWYAQQVCANPLPSGAKLVDVLDIHAYPQGDCVDGLGCDLATAEDAAHSARRLRALRELYDPSWRSEDWIGNPGDLNEPSIRLVPRMREIIAANCPGMGLAITEYRWGFDEGASGALAQAEALAIMGREGVDIATRWVAPDAGTATEDAFRLFLDYDSAAGGFQQVMGDSGKVTKTGAVTNDDDVGAYAVHGADGKLRVLLFNHSTGTSTVNVAFAVKVTGPAQLWKFAPASSPTPPATRITAQAPIAVAASGQALATPVSLAPRTAMLIVVGLPAAGLPFADGFEVGTSAYWAH